MSYRKMSRVELEELYRNLRGYFDNQDKYAGVVAVVNKYFKNPCTILLSIDSEYNDNTYDNELAGVYVYDSKNVEMGLAMEERSKFIIEAKGSIGYIEESQDTLDDIVIYVSKDLPDVYLKEK